MFKNLRINKTELFLCLVLVLLGVIWMDTSSAVYEWYRLDENGIVLKKIYHFLDGRMMVNIPISILILCLFILRCIRIWKDNDFSIIRPFLLLFLLEILYYDCGVKYAVIAYFLDYRLFFTILLVSEVLLKTTKCIYLRIVEAKSRKKQDKTKIGFSTDGRKGLKVSTAVEKYAQEIVERLLKTDIKNESFALGITGDWGSGKTTFLDELKKQINGRAEVVYFNPWMCSSPEQVTSDFFSSLRHQLSSKYSSLSSPIKEYAKYIGKFSITPNSFINFDFDLSNPKSLYERKTSLSKIFRTLPHPVVVIIDDLDRLESNEVFEVLRLIRNTADLSNIIYMVAYDKEYVTNVLNDKNIKEPSAYLEKIFPVEIHLPKVDDDMIWETFQTEIVSQSDMGSRFAEALFNNLSENDRELILRVLDNYRRTKRFARLYMLNVAYIKQNVKYELKLLDVFWLELLQMYDKKTYEVLANDPGQILYVDDGRYHIRDGIISQIKVGGQNCFEEKPFWKEETPRLLDKMFGRYIKTKGQSICFTENYHKFFTLSVSPFKLSIEEMRQLLMENANPDVIVNLWLNSGKFFSSIVYQLKQVMVSDLNETLLTKYILGILFFAKEISGRYNHVIKEIKQLLWNERFIKGHNKLTHDIVLNWFQSEIGKSNDNALYYLSELLNRLYVTIIYDENGQREKSHDLVVSNIEIEKLLIDIMNKYLQTHQSLIALDVMKTNEIFGQIFMNGCVKEIDAMDTADSCVYKQVVFDTVIQFFASKQNKPSIIDFNTAYDNLFKQEIPQFDDADEENEYWSYMSDTYDYNMQRYFGSSYDRSENNIIEEFKDKCFIQENPVETVVITQDSTTLDNQRRLKIDRKSKTKLLAKGKYLGKRGNVRK